MKKIFLILIAFTIVACGGNKEDKINDEFSDKGTKELMEEVSKDEYTPPEDYNLSEKQVEMYIAVKKAELDYAKQAAENLKEKSEKLEKTEKEGKKHGLGDYMTAFKAIGDVADFVTADVRAAKKLGYNSQEYVWVKEVILKTELSEWSEKTMESVSDSYAETLETLKEQREAATSDEMKAMFDEQIKSIEDGMKEMENQEKDKEVTEHNIELLAKYKDQIKAIETEVTKLQYLEKEQEE